MTRVPPSPASARPRSPGVVTAGSRVLGALASHAQTRSEDVAVAAVGPDGAPSRALTFRCLDETVAGLAGVLRGAAAPGDVVLLIGPGGPLFVAWLLAGVDAGVRVLPVHPRSTPAEIGDLAERSAATVVVAGDGVTVPYGPRSVPIESIGDGRRPGAPERVRCEAGAIVLVSSGTTGRSKLVLRESPALDADAANVARAAGLGPGDVVLLGVPTSHSYGVDFIAASVLAGAALLVLDPFDASAGAAALDRHATVLPGVPFMLEALARARRSGSGRLRLAISAGSPLPERVARGFERARGCRPGQLYGASELGSVTLCHPASPLFAQGSVGTPMAGVSIRILDPVDPARRLAAGEEGQVAVSAPSMLSGYLDGPVPLAEGHFLTGDLGVLDEAGRLFITGRLKHVIDVGGLKINPQEVEAALGDHPAVAECVVVPVEASDTVTRLRAVFVARDVAHPPADSELRSFLRARLSAHKIPRVFEAVPSLPRSPTGKILRAQVAGRPC